MESNRQRKVAQIIQEDMAEIFRKQASESKQSFLVSVSDVKVTADLSIAKIYLSIFPADLRQPILTIPITISEESLMLMQRSC